MALNREARAQRNHELAVHAIDGAAAIGKQLLTNPVVISLTGLMAVQYLQNHGFTLRKVTQPYVPGQQYIPATWKIVDDSGNVITDPSLYNTGHWVYYPGQDYRAAIPERVELVAVPWIEPVPATALKVVLVSAPVITALAQAAGPATAIAGLIK